MSKKKADEARHMTEEDVMEKVHHSLRKHENLKKKVHLKGVAVDGHVEQAKKVSSFVKQFKRKHFLHTHINVIDIAPNWTYRAG